MYETSAFHHVKNWCKISGGDSDDRRERPRVDVWQSAKMAARLQSATTSGKPILLRVDYSAGHGASASRTQYHEQLADVYAFLFEHLK